MENNNNNSELILQKEGQEIIYNNIRKNSMSNLFNKVSHLRGVQFFKIKMNGIFTLCSHENVIETNKDIGVLLREDLIRKSILGMFVYEANLVELLYIKIGKIPEIIQVGEGGHLAKKYGQLTYVYEPDYIEILVGVRLPTGNADFYISSLRIKIYKIFPALYYLECIKMKFNETGHNLYSIDLINRCSQQFEWDNNEKKWDDVYIYFIHSIAIKKSDRLVSHSLIPLINHVSYFSTIIAIDAWKNDLSVAQPEGLSVDLLESFFFNPPIIHEIANVYDMDFDGINKTENGRNTHYFPRPDALSLGFRDGQPLSVYMLINIIRLELYRQKTVVKLRYVYEPSEDSIRKKLIKWIFYSATKAGSSEIEDGMNKDKVEYEKKLFIKSQYAKKCICINGLRDHLNGLVISLITEASSIFCMPNFYTEYIPMHELEFLVTEYKDEAIKRIMLNPKLYLWTED